MIEVDQFPLAFSIYGHPLVITFTADHGWRGLQLIKNTALILKLAPSICGSNSSALGYFVACRNNNITLIDMNPTDNDYWKVEGIYPFHSAVNMTKVEIIAGIPISTSIVYVSMSWRQPQLDFFGDWIILFCFSHCFERQMQKVLFENLHGDPLSFITPWKQKGKFNPYIYTLSKLSSFGYEIYIF